MLCCALSLCAAHAAGQERYRVVAGCPSQQSFDEKLRTRLEGVAVASGFSTEVRVEQKDAAFSGSVRVQHLSTVRVRTLSATSCADLVDALALSAALAIEELESEASTPPAAPSTTGPPAAKPIQASHAPTAPRIGGGLSLPFRSTAGPDGALGFGALAIVEARGVGFAPGAQLHVYYHAATARGATGSAKLTTLGAALDACPWRFSTNWSFGPCLSFEIASLRAEAQGVALPKNPARLSLVVAAGGRGRVHVSPAFALEGELFALVPLVRHRFVFDTGESVFQLPAVGARTGLSAVILF